MKQLIGAGISFGIIGAILTELGGAYGILTWVCFVAMLSYCCTEGGKRGLMINMATNLVGVMEGGLIILLGRLIPFHYSAGIAAFLVVIIMCTQANFKLLSFIPGTFAGCASLFGSNNDWRNVVIALVIGNVAAVIGQVSGNKIGAVLEKRLQPDTDSKTLNHQ